MEYAEAAELNKNLPVPLYFQLKESLRKRIATRQWKPGRQIPTEAEICQMYAISRITVRKALQDLQDEGYLEKKQGIGTFVKTNTIEQKLSKFYSFSEELKKSGRMEKVTVYGFETVPADDEVAAGLHIMPGQSVYRIRRIRSVEGTPYAYEISYIPHQLADGLTADMVSGKGLYTSLASLGVTVDSAVEKLRAINLEEGTAELLGVRVDEAAILLIRTAFCGPTTVEYCVSTVVGDFFSYTVELK